jgi:murein DD-endopeptidase MepM/ murein hydrolase activator NlpD
MSFVMIATGPTSRGSGVRTLATGRLLLGAALAAFVLLASGVGLGCWISAPAEPAPGGEPGRAPASLAFTLEQIGTLSGRLFRLESQARQLNERLGARPGAPSAAAPQPSGRKSGSGGPMLPPRPVADALIDLGALEARFAHLEEQITVAADASSLKQLESMHWPTRLPIVDGEATSPFGNRDDPFTGRPAFHTGLDFAAEPGTAIHAAAGGMVVFAGFRSDFGWMVEIDHGNGLSTRYAHASKLLVRARTLVAPGEVIAMSGSSGRSTGPHLHFEVLRHGDPADPRRYLAGL